ncbi:MAG: hypothetical protein HYY84_02050 [Deltaproteobacteria bacterium]|nr:hypothetical protein [Deltaproteobacteria bacterium]
MNRALLVVAATFLVGVSAKSVADVRVENRVLTKRGHLFPRLGFAYLFDESFYRNPGLNLGASHYLTETLAVDGDATLLFSSLNAAGQAVVDTTGLVPDAAAPELLLSLGVRWAFGYGKMQIESGGGIARLIPSVAGHGVVKKTAVDWNGGFRMELALLLQLHRYFNVSIAWAFVGTVEFRGSRSFHASQLATLAVGSTL